MAAAFDNIYLIIICKVQRRLFKGFFTASVTVNKYKVMTAVTVDGIVHCHFGKLNISLLNRTIDADQVFIFHNQGKPGTLTEKIDLVVTVVGNSSVTVTKLPTGQYTVTELTDWSWRYENATAQRQIELTYNDGANEITYENSRENGKWLDGNAVTDCRP